MIPSLKNKFATIKNKVSKNKIYWLALIIWIVLLQLATLIWFQKNNTPPFWDQAYYLKMGYGFYQNFNNNGLMAYWRSFGESAINPPLLPILISIFLIIFGQSELSIHLVILFLILLFNLSLFLLTKKLFDIKTGFFACVIASTFPIVFSLSRQYFVEYLLAALVCLWIYFLIQSDYIKNNYYNFLLGIILGAGILLKIYFPLFILGPLAIILFYRIKNYKFNIRIFLNLSIIFLTAMIFGLWWYLLNYSEFILCHKNLILDLILGGFTAGSSALDKVMGQITQIIYIPVNISIYYFFIALILVFVFAKKKSPKIKKKSESINLYLTLSAILLPLLIFSFLRDIYIRHILPIYPFIATLIAYSLVKFAKLKYILILLSLPIFFYLYLSLDNNPAFSKNINVYVFPIYLNDYREFKMSYEDSVWPNEKILKTLIDNRANGSGVRMIDHRYINPSNMNYYAIVAKSDIKFNEFQCNDQWSFKENIDYNLDTQFILLKDKDSGIEPSCFSYIDIRKILDQKGSYFSKIDTFSLPDNSSLMIYKHK